VEDGYSIACGRLWKVIRRHARYGDDESGLIADALAATHETLEGAELTTYSEAI